MTLKTPKVSGSQRLLWNRQGSHPQPTHRKAPSRIMNSDSIERLPALRRASESIGRPLTSTDVEDMTAAGLLFTNEELMIAGELPEKPQWLKRFPQYLTCYLPESPGGWQFASDALNKKMKSRTTFRTCLMVTLLCQRCSVLRCFDKHTSMATSSRRF